jgi:hypothetical protein
VESHIQTKVQNRICYVSIGARPHPPNRHHPWRASDTNLEEHLPLWTFETWDICSHNHSLSSGQSQIQGTSFWALQFEPSSSNSSLSSKVQNGVIRVLGLEHSLSPPHVVHKCSNASLLKVIEEVESQTLMVPEFVSAWGDGQFR